MERSKSHSTIAEIKKAARPNKHEKKCKCSGNEISNSKGETIVTATRNSFNLLFPLPYCIWGTIYISTSFGVVLQQYLPPGITVTTTNDNNNIIFAFTDGISTDTITVTVPGISLISYPELLTNLNTNYMRSNLIMFNCNADDNPPALPNDQIRNLQGGGLFLQKLDAGTNAKDVQLVIPGSRTGINNSVLNVLEIYLRNEPIKPDTVWIHQFAYIPSVTPVKFSFTVFISERINMNAEREKNLS